MPEQNDNQDPIEEFFERKLWDYKVPFRESDWMDLEDRLDIRDRQRTRNRRRRWMAAAAIVFLALLGYFTYQNYNQINEINRQLQAEQPVDTQEARPGDALTEADRSPDNASGQEPVSERGGNLTDAGSTDDTQLENEQGETSAAGINGIPSNPQEDDITDSQGIAGSLSPGGAETLFISEIACTHCQLADQNLIARNNLLQATNTGERYYRNTPVGAEEDHFFTTVEQDDAENRTASAFSIDLLAGPDLSTAGLFSDFYNPGYTLGFKAEYEIAPGFSLRAGVQQSQVRYTVGSSDYNPPQGYWTGGIAANRTTAECLLLDIPVSLKYEVLQLANSRLYASTGLSSYIMLNETYSFDYNYQQEGLVQEWSEKTGTGYWFSNAMVSVGYELKLRQNWSIRAEPYLKLPLKGVGWGNVDLYSTGTVVALNYKFGS